MSVHEVRDVAVEVGHIGVPSPRRPVPKNLAHMYDIVVVFFSAVSVSGLCLLLSPQVARRWFGESDDLDDPSHS